MLKKYQKAYGVNIYIQFCIRMMIADCLAQYDLMYLIIKPGHLPHYWTYVPQEKLIDNLIWFHLWLVGIYGGVRLIHPIIKLGFDRGLAAGQGLRINKAQIESLVGSVTSPQPVWIIRNNTALRTQKSPFSDVLNPNPRSVFYVDVKFLRYSA